MEDKPPVSKATKDASNYHDLRIILSRSSHYWLSII